MSSPNPNALTYNLYVQQICTMAVAQYSVVGGVTTPVDAEFQSILPSMLNYAEQRIQRDLDILPSQITNATYSLTLGTNTLTISANDFQTIQTVAYTSGTANVPLLPASKEFVQNAYNDSGSTYRGPPLYFAMCGGDTATGGNTSSNIIFGPYSDQTYALSVTGTQWLPSLYASQSTNGLGTTYISTNFPDLLVQASLVYVSQFQRNFLATSNDPQMPGAFEAQYQTLLRGALELENRKKFRDAAWSSQSQSPVATPTR